MIFESKRPEIVDPRTSAIIPVELFVGVLGASRYVLRGSLSVSRSDRVDHRPRAHGGVLRLAWVSPGSEGWPERRAVRSAAGGGGAARQGRAARCRAARVCRARVSPPLASDRSR